MSENIDFHTEPQSYLTVEGIGVETEWIPAAKIGEVVNLADSAGVITKEALEKSIGSWKGKKIFKNHETEREGEKILDDKFEDPFLYFLLEKKTVDALKAGSGGSIDATALAVEDKRILDLVGEGYSVLDANLVPACPSDMGCGIPIAGVARIAKIDTKWDFKKADYSIDQLKVACAWENTAKPKEDRTKEDYKLPFKLSNGTIVWRGVHAAMGALNGARQDVNIPSKDRKSVYNILVAAYKLFDKEPPELKALVKAEAVNETKGGKENMADEKQDVTFSKEQVAEIKAAAVAELTEQLGNEHKVAMSELETAQATKMDELGKEHATELETERTAIIKQAAMIESLATMYGLSNEAKKTLSDAKTLEDALTLFGTLKVEKAEPVVAAKGDGEKSGGIVMGAGKVEAAAPKTQKIEEVGNYNPYTRKFEPSFREELI